MKHLAGSWEPSSFQQTSDLLRRASVFRWEVELIDPPLGQFLDGPKQEHHDYVFTHSGGGQAQGGDLMKFVVGGVMGENDELGLIRHGDDGVAGLL
ncbi:MAG: hypothetical protein U0231_05400 [Nitrospiraceae bacterium]